MVLVIKRRVFMKNKRNNDLEIVFDTSSALFDLKQKASQIKNCYALQNKINELICFVESAKLGYSN